MENMELILNGEALSEMIRQEIAGCVRENIAVDKEFYPAILEEIKKSVTDLWNEREQKYLEYLKQKTVKAIINSVFDGLQEKAIPMLQEAINARYGELTQKAVEAAALEMTRRGLVDYLQGFADQIIQLTGSKDNQTNEPPES